VNLKTQLGLLVLCLGVVITCADARQKKVEKPDVHADFQFGMYPWSRPAVDLMNKEQARLITIGLHKGWNFDKLSKEFKVSVTDLTKIADELDEQRLTAMRNEFDQRPAMVVIREREIERLQSSIERHTDEFANLIAAGWSEIEAAVMALEGSKVAPKNQVMYEAVVSGLLFGAMIDAFFDDKTLMPPGPRRVRNDRYYAWLVESNPGLAGTVRRELRESDGYRIITIGPALPEERLNVGDLRGNATVYDDDDARRYRVFMSLFSRDKLLPFFKTRRDEFIRLGRLIESGRYTAFAEFFAWYYNAIANRVVDGLIADGRITPPEKLYTYAIRVAQ
jgi:hypothetical protein